MREEPVDLVERDTVTCTEITDDFRQLRHRVLEQIATFHARNVELVVEHPGCPVWSTGEAAALDVDQLRAAAVAAGQRSDQAVLGLRVLAHHEGTGAVTEQ